MNINDEFKAVNEKSRTYIYPDGQEIKLQNIVAVRVSESGNHRLNTADGMKHIIVPGWRHLLLDVEQWTF